MAGNGAHDTFLTLHLGFQCPSTFKTFLDSQTFTNLLYLFEVLKNIVV